VPRLAPAHAPSLLCQGHVPRGRVRATRVGGPRAPSAGMMPDIAAEPGSLAFAVRLTLAHQTPYTARSEALPVSPEWPIRATQRGLRRPCGRHRQRGEDASRRLLQPTYSTSTGDTARFLCQRRLAAPSARVEGSVDAVPPASARPPTPSLLEERSIAPERRCPTAAFSTARRALGPTSDALCRPPASSEQVGRT